MDANVLLHGVEKEFDATSDEDLNFSNFSLLKFWRLF